MDDEDLTPAEQATIFTGLRDLGTIDALMTVLTRTLMRYPDDPIVATGLYADLINDATEAASAWQDFRNSPFGHLFDPRVQGSDESPE